MVSKVHKRTAMYRNLQLLRSITYSHSPRLSSALFYISTRPCLNEKIVLERCWTPEISKSLAYTFVQELKIMLREGFISCVFMQRRKTSVLLDAPKYIQGLKQKLQELNQLAAATSQKTIAYDPMPTLKVEPQKEGFMIKVLSQRSCQGLLVFILEAFEELGLDVLQARVSCEDRFCLEAVGIKENNQDTRHLDAQLVEQVVSQAIQNWRKVTQQ